ncbi:MAG: hypothetical protein EOO63_05500 [Hymenobacter sp.]|nr:MAG: hypothetical protein EOO63_05500 [Hymenobacter sp.]
MRFLPWFTEEFRSSLLPFELLQQLQSNVILPQAVGLGVLNSYRNFKGTVAVNSFTIQLLASVAKTPKLVLAGSVRNVANGGSFLRLRYRLTWDSLFFLLFWEGVTGIIIVLDLRNSFHTGYTADMVVPVVFFIFGFGFMLLLFWLEVHTARQLLVKLLKLEPAH